MTDTAFRLTVYDVAADHTASFPQANATRFVYAPDAAVAIREASEDHTILPDDGRFARGSLDIEGRAWVFECASADRALSESAGIEPVLSHRLAPAFSGAAILRADRVASPPGARTPRHGHRGPGIRRLLRGTIRASIGDTVERFDTGRAWFESGTDWVVGENVSGYENVFVRVMLLPAELASGHSSFVPATLEEGKAPRAIEYRLLGEMELDR